jgi:hypothetical protein
MNFNLAPIRPMTKRRFLSLLLAFLPLALFAPSVLHAQSGEEDAIKQRMLSRVPQIDALKTSGKVGENNVGLLEQRSGLSREERELMNAENSDRRALYTLVAKRVGLTVSVVGQGRAEEIRNKSAKGVWLQAPDGKWYQK